VTADALAILHQVEERILDLPEDKFLNLMVLLHEIRSHPDAARAIEKARPRMIRLRPPRPPSIQRIFYYPFEDLLCDGLAAPTQDGQVPREAMQLCWKVVASTIGAQTIQGLEQRLAASQDRRRQITDLGRKLWPAAAKALRTALARANEDPSYADVTFGGSAILPLLTDIAGLLPLAEEIETLKERFPEKPVQGLTDEDIEAIQATITRIREQGLGEPRLLIWALAARMANPADFLLRFLEGGAAAAGEASGKLIDASVVRLADELRRVEAEVRESHSALDVAGEAAKLADTLMSARQFADKRKHLEAPLKEISTHLKRMVETEVLENAHTTVLDAVPAAPATADDGLPELPPDSALIDAENRVRALRKCAKFAGAVDLDKAVGDKLKGIADEVEHRAMAMLDALPKDAPATEAKPVAERHLCNSVRMLELAQGPNAAEKVLRTGLSRIAKAFAD